MEYRYKAFISYRHQSPDQDVAGKLHSYIENYAIPSSLKKTLGIQKMGRVFRDQEELEISPSLGDDIHEALEQSEWFICICSPRYLRSKWCMEELNYFLSLGRRDHILTILTEGEPEEVFPEELRSRASGDAEEEVEPLAADVRGANVSEVLKKLQQERLRILAPMLGVRYDDLRQRARQRRTRMIMAAGAAVILLLAGFLGYAFHKNGQVSAERNAALAAESGWLAKSAEEALSRNDRMLSLMLYLEALPKDVKNPERPVIDDAANGLISAVIGSNATNTYTGVTTIELDRTYENRILDLKGIDHRLFLTARDGIEVYDMDTGAFLQNLETEEDDIYGTFIKSEEDYFVYHKDYFETHRSINGTVIKTYEESYEYDAPLQMENPNSSPLYTLTYYDGNAEKAVYGDSNLFHTENQSWHVPDRRFEEWICDAVVTNEEYVVTTYSGGTHGKTEFSHVFLVDKYNEIVKTFSYTVESTDYYGEVWTAIASPDGSVIFGMSDHHLYLWNRQSGEWFRTVSFDRLDNTEIVGVKAPSQSSSTYIAIRTEGGNVYFYDYVKDEVTLKLDNSFYKLKSMMFNYDGNRILCAADHERALIFSCTDGSLLETLEADFSFSTAEYALRDYYGNAKSDIYIILCSGGYGPHNDGEVKKIMIYSTNAGSEAERYKTALPVTGFSMAQFSPGNKTVWLAQGGSNVINTPLCICDTASGNQLAILDDLTSRIYSFGRYMISVPEIYDLGFLEDDTPYFRVYDADTFEEVTTVYPTYPHVFGREGQYTEAAGMMFDSPQFTGDGKTMFLQWNHGETISYSEAFVFAYDTETWEEKWRITLYNAFDHENNSVMPETDAYDGDLYLYAYPVGEDRVLIEYLYNPGTAKYSVRCDYTNRFAYELRDAASGEVLERFAPEGAFRCDYDKENSRFLLYADEDASLAHEPALVFDAETFEDLTDAYIYEEPEEEESPIDLGGSIQAENADLMLVRGKNEYFILRMPSLEEAMESAKKILGDRTLSEEQRETYFLQQ